MIAQFLLALCVLAGQSEPRPTPAPEEVTRVERALGEAFESRDPKLLAPALDAARSVPSPTIVRRLGRGLAHENRDVRLAVLQTLRWVEHDDALELLHRVTQDKRLSKDAQLYAATLRAIGQHAAPRSIQLLARNPFEPDDHACRRARIFGLARVRTLESLEALLGILAITVPGPSAIERRIQGQMDDMRIGLVILTGTDQGLAPERWEDWWRKNRKSFRIPAEIPPLSREMRLTWDAFWGLPQVYTREERREDRGRRGSR